MWLLDKNVPVQLKPLLSEFGIESVTADSQGWGQLTNGKLVAAAGLQVYPAFLPAIASFPNRLRAR
jgi:hypothetical protein